jgi:hypothetical protein
MADVFICLQLDKKLIHFYWGIKFNLEVFCDFDNTESTYYLVVEEIVEISIENSFEKSSF